MKLTIAIVQSRVTLHWSYCPEQCVKMLHMELDDKPTYWTTAQEALDHARGDKSIPAGSQFKVLS